MSQYKASDGDFSFGLNMLAHVEDGNAPISPANLRGALAMVYEGATGETAKEIAHVAQFSEDPMERLGAAIDLTQALNAEGKPYVIRTANGIWTAQNYPLNENYKKTLVGDYGAEADSANFQGNAEGEKKKINGWVSEKTEEKIPELFKGDSINDTTILVLASALYFKAPWEEEFKPEHTQKQDYTLSTGETVQVDMMRKGYIAKDLPKFLHGSFDGYDVAVLPYKGNELMKVVLLPTQGEDVKGLESHLRDNNMGLDDISRNLTKRDFAKLELPKHEVRGNYDLNSPLSKMGIAKMFTESAELDKMGPGDLHVSSGVHETYFKTDEEGSEGAAATGIVVGITSVGRPPEPPVEFVVDKPYLEAITHKDTGAVLFLNRIADPR